MQKSLFARYFTLFTTILMVSVTIFGFVFYAMCSNYFKEDRVEVLEKRSQQASALISQNYFSNKEKFIDATVIKSNLDILSHATEADIMLSDLNGRIIINTEHRLSVNENSKVPADVIDTLLDGSYTAVGKLGSVLGETCYIVGLPVVANEKVIGAVFAASSASALTELLRELAKMFIMGAIIIIFIAFIAIYFTTDSLVNPLRAMLKATDSFARGEFSVRVPIKGEDEVSQLAKAFNDMAGALASQEAMSRTFVANVSHELRTPMTSIGGFIDGMLDGTIEHKDFPKYLTIVSDEVKRLSRMVISMLNISKIEAGEMKLNPSTVDVNEIMFRTILGFEQRIDEKSIEIEGLDSGKNFASADPDMVAQIMYNLVENAVKFTPQNGKISIGYTEEGKMLRISVRNTGAGIEKEEIPKLFDRFYKSDRSRSINKKGVGLGLNIVKSLVNLHGGTISVASNVGEYAEFSFTLPLADQKSGAGLFRKSKKEL